MRLVTDITPLRRSPAFRRLWAGSTLSQAGGSMTSFAVTLQVYDATRSTAATGAIGAATLLPMLLVALPSWSLGWVWLAYALVAASSASSAVSAPARRAFIPSLVPAGQLPAAMALSRVSFQVTLIAGPVLAGLVTGAAVIAAALPAFRRYRVPPVR